MKKSTKRWIIVTSTPVVVGVLQYLVALAHGEVNWVGTALLLLGMYGGFGLLLADVEWLHQYYQQPTEVNPEQELLSPEYITRSAVFILTLIPLTIFMLTSTGSSMGMGMLLGILIGLSLEMFALRADQLQFQARFLSQVKRPFTTDEIEKMIVSFCTFSAIVTLLVII